MLCFHLRTNRLGFCLQLTWNVIPNQGHDPEPVPNVILQMWKRMDLGQRPFPQHGEEEKQVEEKQLEEAPMWLGPDFKAYKVKKGQNRDTLLGCLSLL